MFSLDRNLRSRNLSQDEDVNICCLATNSRVAIMAIEMVFVSLLGFYVPRVLAEAVWMVCMHTPCTRDHERLLAVYTLRS